MIHQDLEEVYQYLTNFLTEERLQKIEYFSAQSSDFILPIMEDVYQFRNAAAIVRSAEACGLHRIVALEKINVFQPNLDLTKGADTWVEIVKHPAHIDSIKNIKQQGYKIVAVSPEKNATLLPDFNITEPIALTFGTEWQGVTEEILDFADETLAIPMYGFTQSFNVSVAAAICFYELKQKLIRNNIPHLLNKEKLLKTRIRWAVNSIRSGNEILNKYLDEKGVSHDILTII
jgi:tRNA/rRNA methyltransferase